MMEELLLKLNRKLDALTAQVTYLSEQARAAEWERQTRGELVRDLTPIASEAFRLSAEQLEDMQAYVKPEALLRLLKRLLRNRQNLDRLLDQLESVMDLAETMGPLADQGFGKVVDMLSAYERKGYFAFLRGGLEIVDNVVVSFSEDEVKRLGENVVLILNTVKDMTQPEIMNFVRSTLLVAEGEVQKPVDTSYLALLGQMRDPAVRRGLALTMRVLHVVGAQAEQNGH
jgi:uncharacterized protein YjgD (DUF1641 family)